MQLEGVGEEELHHPEPHNAPDEAVNLRVPEVVAEDDEGLIDAPHRQQTGHQVLQIAETIVYLFKRERDIEERRVGKERRVERGNTREIVKYRYNPSSSTNI